MRANLTLFEREQFNLRLVRLPSLPETLKFFASSIINFVTGVVYETFRFFSKFFEETVNFFEETLTHDFLNNIAQNSIYFYGTQNSHQFNPYKVERVEESLICMLLSGSSMQSLSCFAFHPINWLNVNFTFPLPFLQFVNTFLMKFC